MKVLHIIPSLALVRGGPTTALLEMTKALINTGIKVDVISTNDNGSELLPVPLEQKIDYYDIPVTFFSRFSPSINFIREFCFSSSLTKWLWANIQNYDLVHIHMIFAYPSTVGMLIARLKKVPYVVSTHGMLCEWSLAQKTAKKKAYLKIIERANLESSSGIIFTTELEKQEASQTNLQLNNFVLPLGLNPIHPIPNARDKLCRKLNLPTDIPIILFLSRVHPKKGLDILINCLSNLQDLEFNFIIAGSGSDEYEESIKSLVQEKGLNDQTYWTGFVDGEWKNTILQGADVFALTSYSENFGVVVLEALLSATPVILTPGVALSTIVAEHNLGYVTPLDNNSITKTLAKAIKNPQQLKMMGEIGQKYVCDSYAWEQIALQQVSLYEKIINI